MEGRHRDTIDTLTRVREFLPKDATIIPGHGRPMKRSEIDFPIRYLRELDRAVAEAVANGHSVEDTLRKVTMSNYGEYSLFDWAHNQVNVPAAHAFHLTDNQIPEKL